MAHPMRLARYVENHMIIWSHIHKGYTQQQWDREHNRFVYRVAAALWYDTYDEETITSAVEWAAQPTESCPVSGLTN